MISQSPTESRTGALQSYSTISLYFLYPYLVYLFDFILYILSTFGFIQKWVQDVQDQGKDEQDN
ncbi:MAG: hypothetical protein A2Z96_07950 [Spirochaetes bacterium GWB1_48_6]|nr:MAG: hypothetical protein A2Z96_07950 [Spirochaetes bacterium GWB1_48_6]